LNAMRIVDFPFGSRPIRNVVVELPFSRERFTVIHLPCESRCSCTRRPANDVAPPTCVATRARVMTCSDRDGRTPTVTVGLVTPFAFTAYEVRIVGCAG